jgi:hypothetical protein
LILELNPAIDSRRAVRTFGVSIVNTFELSILLENLLTTEDRVKPIFENRNGISLFNVALLKQNEKYAQNC